MKGNKRLIASVAEIIFGFILSALSFTGMIDEYWGGMGTALVIVGGIFLFRQIKYKTNNEYQQSVDVELNDERNKFISMKAWSWAGYFFVIIAAAASIILKVIGLDEYVSFASGSVCLIIILYWLSYMVIRKKY